MKIEISPEEFAALTPAMQERQGIEKSLFDVEQEVSICLDDATGHCHVTIDGQTINNVSGVAWETEGDEADYIIATIKVRVRANKLSLSAEQITR